MTEPTPPLPSLSKPFGDRSPPARSLSGTEAPRFEGLDDLEDALLGSEIPMGGFDDDRESVSRVLARYAMPPEEATRTLIDVQAQPLAPLSEAATEITDLASLERPAIDPVQIRRAVEAARRGRPAPVAPRVGPKPEPKPYLLLGLAALAAFTTVLVLAFA